MTPIDPLFFGYYQNERVSSKEILEFKLCSRGSYLKEGGELFCHTCKTEAICQGGYIPIKPK